MSARLGLRKLSPSRDTACTTSATIVASDSASWRWRRSGRPLTSLPPNSRPTQTATLDSSSAAVPAARLVIQKRWSVTAAASMVVLYDWLVVTADGALPELEPVADELSSDELEPDDESDEPELEELVVPSDPLELDAVVCVAVDDAVVPMGPPYAIAAKATVNTVSDTAATRLRIREIRAARARSFSRASCFGEGVCSVMAVTVGARCESGPGRTRGVPGARRLSKRPRGGPGVRPGAAPTISPWHGCVPLPRRGRSPHETQGAQARRDHGRGRGDRRGR